MEEIIPQTEIAQSLIKLSPHPTWMLTTAPRNAQSKDGRPERDGGVELLGFLA